MKGKRYTDGQIVRIFREVESGTSIATVCRSYGVSQATVHRWRSKYRGTDQARLKKLVSSQSCRDTNSSTSSDGTAKRPGANQPMLSYRQIRAHSGPEFEYRPKVVG